MQIEARPLNILATDIDKLPHSPVALHSSLTLDPPATNPQTPIHPKFHPGTPPLALL
jgi:hypothetical protein